LVKTKDAAKCSLVDGTAPQSLTKAITFWMEQLDKSSLFAIDSQDAVVLSFISTIFPSS
jgi:hypothetical protein